MTKFAAYCTLISALFLFGCQSGEDKEPLIESKKGKVASEIQDTQTNNDVPETEWRFFEGNLRVQCYGGGRKRRPGRSGALSGSRVFFWFPAVSVGDCAWAMDASGGTVNTHGGVGARFFEGGSPRSMQGRNFKKNHAVDPQCRVSALRAIACA